MILTIDIGNSNIVLGGVEGDEIRFEARLRTDATKTSDEYCIDLKMILEVYGISQDMIEGTIIASVVPQVLNSVQTAVKKLTGKAALVVGPGLKTGLHRPALTWWLVLWPHCASIRRRSLLLTWEQLRP